jgi:hypothetical protein
VGAWEAGLMTNGEAKMLSDLFFAEDGSDALIQIYCELFDEELDHLVGLLVRVFNAHVTGAKPVQVDNVTLQSCVAHLKNVDETLTIVPDYTTDLPITLVDWSLPVKFVG